MARSPFAQGQVKYVWAPQPGPQAALVKCPVFEIFYGGARGGGKTDGMLGRFAIRANIYRRACKGIFFRRELPQLEAAIARSKELYLKLGACWHEQKKSWTFPGGATLKFRPLERDTDAEKYQGHDYTDVMFEELGNYPDPAPYNKLRGTLRSAAGVPVHLCSTGNPGGPGHHWIKERFIDPAPGGWQIIRDEHGQARIFIPAKVQDNQILLDSDPHYVARLKQAGSEALVRAWLDGDWDVVEGAYFDCWRADLHVLRPTELPEHWTRFASFDWGSARPFSVGWWVVASEDYDTGATVVPRGSLIRYREWYGAKSANVGLKLTVEEVAAGILKREGGQAPEYRVADPAIYISDGGPSMAERFVKAGVAFRRGDNKRVPGWDQVRKRLVGENGKPLMYIFSTCVDTIRTLPALQHDQNKPEDVDTDNEDHAGDDVRLACMSRPLLAKKPVDPKSPLDTKQTYNDLLNYKEPVLPRRRI